MPESLKSVLKLLNGQRLLCIKGQVVCVKLCRGEGGVKSYGGPIIMMQLFTGDSAGEKGR